MGFILTLLYIVLTYLSPAYLFPALETYRPMVVVGALAIMVSLPSVPFVTRNLKVPASFLLVGFVGALCMSKIAQGWFGGIKVVLEDFAPSVITFYLILLNVQSLKRVRILSAVIILVSLYLVLQGIAAYYFGFHADILIRLAWEGLAEYYAGRGPSLRRIQALGFLSDPNDLAQQFVLALALVGVAWRKRNLPRNFVAVLLPALFLGFGIYLTGSRGAVVGLLALMFFATLDRMSAFGSAAVSSIMAAAMLLLNFGGGRSFAMSEGSSAGRVEAWSQGLQMFKHHPIFGVGFNSFTDYYRQTAHNSFVLAFSEVGLFGYFFWLGMVVVTISELNAICKAARAGAADPEVARWAKGIRLAAATFLVTSWFLSRTYVVTFYILVALAAVLGNLYRQDKQEIIRAEWTIQRCALIGVMELASVAAVYVMARLRGL